MFAAKNQLLTRRPSGPAFDAVGGGYAISNSYNFSWSHTVGATANCAFLAVSYYGTGTPDAVYFGTSAMTNLVFSSPSSPYYAALYYVSNPPTGAQTVAMDFTSRVQYIIANSITYSGVHSVGTPVTNSGTSGTAAITVPSAAGHRPFCYLSNLAAVGDFSAFNQTKRWSYPLVSANNFGSLYGDAPGASSVAFSATLPSSGLWDAIGIDLS